MKNRRHRRHRRAESATEAAGIEPRCIRTTATTHKGPIERLHLRMCDVLGVDGPAPKPTVTFKIDPYTRQIISFELA